MKLFGLILVFLVTVPVLGQADRDAKDGPDCSGRWPTKAAFADLKNEGILDNTSVDFSKTTTKRLASEKIGDDLYHQIYLVKFTEKSGKVIEAIAAHNASREECSMTGVEVFIVSKHIDPDGK